ncbi:MAG TPA: hypothetical protein VMK66_02510 [Myxococcales bacterium]|nr:hypothetical protein [Myxococcales bacterium]
MKRPILALLVVATGACSTVNSALSGASDQAARNAGASMVGSAGAPQGGAQQASYGGGNMSMATMNPAFLNMYMSAIFTYAFSSGGYDVSPVPYTAGQYTRWNGMGHGDKTVTVERARLGDDAQGRQWWKVKFTDDQGRTTILEGLLDPKQNRFVRMRGKFPDDAEGNEMPVDESAWYHAPTRLSKESVEGATKGIDTVTVPAGTFKAKHVVFGGAAGTHEWWLDGKVPGGTVKQIMKNPRSGDGVWEMQLAAYGGDAKSELNSK